MKGIQCAFLVIALSLSFQTGCGSGLRVANRPVLKNLIVDIETCAVPCSAGAFTFASNYDPSVIFGKQALDTNGKPKVIPNFEFRVNPTANVYSPVNGVVSSIEGSMSTDDSTIDIAVGALSEYRVEIDHVTNVRVSAGDHVYPGQILGNPGQWNQQTGMWGRVELQVNAHGVYLCPMDFMDESVRSIYESKMLQLMHDWEAVKSDPTLYDESAMVRPGCLTHEIKE